jgi:hypothetical protein
VRLVSASEDCSAQVSAVPSCIFNRSATIDALATVLSDTQRVRASTATVTCELSFLASGREKWENIAEGAETWSGITKGDQDWSGISKGSETWTAEASASTTWESIAVGSTDWTEVA